MVLRVPDSGITLESSARSMAGLPAQAFAVTLSDEVLEGMIECVQNGGGIQLSLGDSPTFLFGSQAHQLPESADLPDYDLFYSSSANPKSLDRLPNPTMSILRQPKYQTATQRTSKADKEKGKAKQIKARAPAPKTSAAQKGSSHAGADIETLQLHLAQAQAEKLENSAKVIGGPLPTKKGKFKSSQAKLLATHAHAASKSLPSSPALTGLASPSLGAAGAAGQQAQERAKQRVPIIHELAVRDRTREELLSAWDEGTESEFQTALEKVASFDNNSQRWAMNKLYWKELDVFKYPYKKDEDRQKAIDNAVKQYDRMRLGVSDPLWQKLLPESERGMGICLSKLQAAIAKGPAPPAPKTNLHKADGSSANVSGESEKDDSSQGKKIRGGESMARSNSQPLLAKTKKTTGQTQAKRLLSNKRSASAKPTPRASPTKTVAKPATGKGGVRVLSKEFVSDSDSESEEAPLSNGTPRLKPAPKPTGDGAAERIVERAAERAAERARAADKPNRAPQAAKPKAVPKPPMRVKDTIHAQTVTQAATRPRKPVKRRREEEDDSSSSGTPLSKRLKPKEHAVKGPRPNAAHKHRTSDASQNSLSTSSGASLPKSKNTSPTKSSPLASSPPTNASDLGPPDERETIVAKKRKIDGVMKHGATESKTKRQRLSPAVLQKAHRFKQFYASYEALHREIVALEHPPQDKVTDLLDMRERLRVLKDEIYKEIPAEDLR